MADSTARVTAVVVSFRPDPGRLQQQFELLLEQVHEIVWVDNHSAYVIDPGQLGVDPGRVLCVRLAENRGIGHAQNVGIECARARGASHVLLMDDDSLPQPGMVSALIGALACHPDAAAAGPDYFDARRTQEKSVFFRTTPQGRLVWFDCVHQAGPIDVDHVIASGCLIPVAVLGHVGMMRDDFFIDWVDIEWCLRARALGYSILGVCAARLEHRLGDNVAIIAGREVPVHAPWRHYYQARNLILMLSSVSLEPAMRRRLVWQQVKRFIVFSTLAPRRFSYLRMWLLGLWHGLRGRTGAFIRP